MELFFVNGFILCPGIIIILQTRKSSAIAIKKLLGIVVPGYIDMFILKFLIYFSGGFVLDNLQ